MFQRGQRAQPDAPAPTAGTMRLRIRRCDPDRDPEPHWETYQAPRQPGDRLLDALHHVKVRHEAPCVSSGGERPPPPGCR